VRGKKAKALRRQATEYARDRGIDSRLAYKAIKNLHKEGKVK